MIAFSVMIIPAVPLVSLCLNISFVRGYRLVVGLLLLGLAIYVASVFTILILFPSWAIPISILALAAILLERWHARPNYGVERGLPPGSLALFPVEPLLDHLALFKRAAKYGPIFKIRGSLRRAAMSAWPKPMICIVGLELGRELLTRCDYKLESPEPSFSRHTPKGLLRYMNDGDHHTYRQIFQATISPEVARARAAFITDQIRRCLAEIGAACAGSQTGISPQPYLSRMVLTMWLDLFFGVLPGNPDVEPLERLLEEINPEGAVFLAGRRARKSLADITAILNGQVGQWDVPPHCYLAELLAAEPNALDDRTLMGNLIYLLRMSAGDVESFLRWILKQLAEHPAWLDRTRRDADHSSGLAERIALETLRLEQSEYLTRRAREGLALKDYSIPKGWLVRVCVRESHLDPTVFEDPFSFNPDRFLGHEYSGTEFSPFGIGRHSCLGSHLTMAIAKSFVAELARGYDLQKTADGAREFRQFHWQPSSLFRVRLSEHISSNSDCLEF